MAEKALKFPGLSSPPEPEKNKTLRVLYTIEALMLIIMVVGGIFFTFSYLQNSPRPFQAQKPVVIAGLVEAEKLAVIGKKGDFSFLRQDTGKFVNGRWSDNGHMFASNAGLGNWIEFSLPVPSPGQYKISVYLSQSYDYGIVAFSINGVPTGQTYDLYSNAVQSTGPQLLGTFSLETSQNRLRLEVIGKNPKSNSPYYQFGIDGIKLEKL